MKILVIGAGVIGSYLAHVLHRAGNEVTLLARGAWMDQLRSNGLRIHHQLQRKDTMDILRIIDHVDDCRYDAVFAVMQHQQMWSVLDDLARVNTDLVALVGNNMSAAEMEQEIHAREVSSRTVLFGFQGTAGRREDGRIISVHMKDGSMSLGCLHSLPSAEVMARVEAMFHGTAYRLTWTRDMEAWYRTHLTLILPTCYLCYAADCDLRHVTRQQRKLLLDAANEACGLLAAIGSPVLPDGEEAYYRPGFKRMLMAAMVFVMAKTIVGELVASEHCRHAVTEMEGLDAAFHALRLQAPDFAMPAWDTLRSAMPEWNELHKRWDKQK